MSENPIRPFRPDPLRSAGPAVVMVQSDSRRLVVTLFSVALVLGAGIGILSFLAGRRSEVGKIHPTDIAPFPPLRAVQAANPPPPPLQIVPLPEGSLVREEPPLTPGSTVIGFDGEQPISIEGNGAALEGAALEEKPAIEIRRHEPTRYRNPPGNPPARVLLSPPIARVRVAVPIAAAPDPAAAPIPGTAPVPVAASPEPPPAPVPASAATAAAVDPPADPDPALDSSLKPAAPPP